MEFDFKIGEKEYTYDVNTSIKLHIIRTNNSVAVMYFSDERSDKINIPEGIIVYTYDYQTNKRIIQKSLNKEYVLCWTDDYEIELNGNVLINIRNQRKWNITSV
jgi:hypothetical protein